MKRLALLPLLALAACKASVITPCMQTTEFGTVIAARTSKGEHCGRYGCSPWQYATVTLRMGNGTDRLCVIDDTSADMLEVGSKISIPAARRLY